jgi:maleylacetate reductase
MRVVFGASSTDLLRQEIASFGLSRVLVISTPGQVDVAMRATAQLDDLVVGVAAEARMHVPIEVVDKVAALSDSTSADGCVAVGGGSTIGLGKALALRGDLTIIAVPTTYSGSEMTPIWGVTEGGEKKTGRDIRVLPRSVIYDPLLSCGLPLSVSVSSGLNAVAHAVEALYAPDASPITTLMADEATRSMAAALPGIAKDAGDISSRSRALYAAWLAGSCLGSTTMSLHHKLCHVLGGTFSLPHSVTHAVVLPHVMAYNLPATPAAAELLQRALGAEAPAEALQSLAARLGLPTSLQELGLREADLDRVVELAAKAPYANPRDVSRHDLRALVDDAWRGVRPRQW